LTLIYLFAAGTAVYTGILALASLGLLLMEKPSGPSGQAISVIIAARNEERSLPGLLESLDGLDYDPEAYEIIIVNDHSTDASMKILGKWQNGKNRRVIDWQGQREGLIGKKAAIQIGIEAANYDILAFTDADCLVPKTWLQQISQGFGPQTDYVLAYSLMKRFPDDTKFRLKNFERAIYYALAAAGLYFRKPITSSACNMAYRKPVFLRAGGFDGIGTLASGDDDLLLMKMGPHIRQGQYLLSEEARVTSIEGRDLAKRHHTNIRRASKFRWFPAWLQITAVFVFLYFIAFYAAMVIALWGKGGSILSLALFTKTGTEFGFVMLHLCKLKLAKLGALYPVQVLLFPAQFVFYAMRGTFGKYRWK
jgi:cellulose synthase/poly-beta-1,6-N-acetylglucosamine synthase-like glycosyltransferase